MGLTNDQIQAILYKINDQVNEFWNECAQNLFGNKKESTEMMTKGAKIWVKHLTTHQCKIIRNILFGLTGARSVMGRGGLGATCAYVIEDGDLYDYMDIDETDYDWLPGRELNEVYLLQMQPGDLVAEGRLFKQEGGTFYSTGAWGTVPTCNHVFIPIRGLSRILGYDCKLCGKKKEDC